MRRIGWVWESLDSFCSSPTATQFNTALFYNCFVIPKLLNCSLDYCIHFPGTAFTKFHKFGGLTMEIYCLIVLEAKFKIKVLTGPCSLSSERKTIQGLTYLPYLTNYETSSNGRPHFHMKSLGEIPSFSLLASGVGSYILVSLACRCITSNFASIVAWPFCAMCLSLCVSSLL